MMYLLNDNLNELELKCTGIKMRKENQSKLFNWVVGIRTRIDCIPLMCLFYLGIKTNCSKLLKCHLLIVILSFIRVYYNNNNSKNKIIIIITMTKIIIKLIYFNTNNDINDNNN